MNHDSQNNFRSYYRGYPFNGNAVDHAQASEEVSDETVINAAHDQIEKILTMKPFDPEEFGFKQNGELMGHSKVIDKTTYTMASFYEATGEKYGYWSFSIQVEDNEDYRGNEPINKIFHTRLYIPNDLAGRIILTALGIVPRRDLDENGSGCPNDADLDGICPLCENSGGCQNKLLPT